MKPLAPRLNDILFGNNNQTLRTINISNTKLGPGSIQRKTTSHPKEKNAWFSSLNYRGESGP